MYDTGPRLPEFNAIFLRCTLEKVEDFLVGDNRSLHGRRVSHSFTQTEYPPYPQIRFGSIHSLDQMVTVYGCRDG